MLGGGGSVFVLGGEDIAMFNTAKKKSQEIHAIHTGEFYQAEIGKMRPDSVNQSALEDATVKNAAFAFLKRSRPQSQTDGGSLVEMDNELNVAVTAINCEKTTQ